jgi:hypothetical protein
LGSHTLYVLFLFRFLLWIVVLCNNNYDLLRDLESDFWWLEILVCALMDFYLILLWLLLILLDILWLSICYYKIIGLRCKPGVAAILSSLWDWQISLEVSILVKWILDSLFTILLYIFLFMLSTLSNYN